MIRLERKFQVCALAMISVLVGVLAPGVAGAADVEPTAEGPTVTEAPPPSAILGGWFVTGTRVLPDGGATTYHYERRASEAEGTADAEIQWHSSSAAEIGQQLQAQGFVPGGTLPTRVTDERKLQEEDWENLFIEGTAQVYMDPLPHQQFFQAIGVWEEVGWTYAVSAQVGRLYMLERLLERVERLNGIPGGHDPFASTTSWKRFRRVHRHARRHVRRAARAHARGHAFGLDAEDHHLSKGRKIGVLG
jgi:hypothetical protein